MKPFSNVTMALRTCESHRQRGITLALIRAGVLSWPSAMQFRKFARFDPHVAPLSDRALAERIRTIARRSAWREALPADRRIVFPGYPNLRAMSMRRGRVLQDNIGIGWPTYLRFGNIRIFYEHSWKHQG